MRFIRQTIFSLIVLISILPNITKGETMNVDLTCYVRSYIDDRALWVDKVEVLIVPPPVDATFKHQYYQFQDSSINNNVTSVEVEIIPHAPFINRKIRLRRRGNEISEMKRLIYAYLVKNNADISYTALDRAVQMLEGGKIQRALAIFEHAHQKLLYPNDIRPYLTKVYYNYARALQRNCLTNGYDTCSLSLDLFIKLKDWWDSPYRDEFDTGITIDLIINAINDINNHEKREVITEVLSSFAGVEEAFAQGELGYKVAAQKQEEILQNYDKYADIWKTYGKPKAVLKRDAGLSWLNYENYVSDSPKSPDYAKLNEIRVKALNLLNEAYDLGERSDDTIYGIEVLKHQTQ